MNRILNQALQSLSDLDFRELQLAIQLAGEAREIMRRFQVSAEDFALRMELADDDILPFLSGGYPYHLRDAAKLQAYYCELAGKRATEQIEKKAEKILQVKEPITN